MKNGITSSVTTKSMSKNYLFSPNNSPKLKGFPLSIEQLSVFSEFINPKKQNKKQTIIFHLFDLNPLII